ncbi:MAG: RimK family alpha-L-glutamate ligase [Planctomycetes bacterium]|nr:RimK family alpha-L-glutamate ligase [Planctomycetota bacterium]
MKIGILASEGSWYFRDLQRAADAARHDCQRLDFERLVAQVGSAPSICLAESPADGRTPPSLTNLAAFDIIIVRTMPPGSLEQVVYRMDLLGRLAVAGQRIINSPKSLECAVDKYLTTARLQAAGLPVPETIVCEHEDDAVAAFEQLGRDVVVKPLFGAEGRGIVRVSDPDLAHRTFRTLMRLDSVLYLQRFIDHEGYDVRVLVLNGQVVGAIRRRSPHDFRTNVSRSAIAELHSASALESDYALRAADAAGTYLAGIDLLYDRQGRCYVIEVNAVPGWQAFTRATGIDVAARFLESLDH